LMIGPNINCPIKIFFKVDAKSVLGKILDRKPNHMCCVGPKTNSPYIAIRSVLIRSNEAQKLGSVII